MTGSFPSTGAGPAATAVAERVGAARARRRSRLWGTALLLALPLVPPVIAPAQAQDRTASFDVPPQPLADALTAAARQAGVQILFPHDLVRGRTSRRLSGRMTTRAAIERLIAGSPLEIAAANAQVVTLRRASIRRALPPRPAASPPVSAATLSPPPSPPPEILVTGRPLATPLADAEASYAVSTIDGARLAASTTRSTAELLRLVPGFWVESSGGEAANNVRVRGIPTDGYSSVAIEENGLPVQYDGGLGFLNTDQVFRLDETVARVEAVRGGPSSLFASSAPGGVLNFISRNGLDQPGGTATVTIGPDGYGRVDGYVAGRIASTLGLLVGGFYRVNDGRRDTGFRADEGGQIRANLVWRDGPAEVALDLRRLDDRVAFYLPVPLGFRDDGSIGAVAGFDPLEDTLAGPDTADVRLRGADGDTRFDLKRGTDVALTAFTLAARTALGGDWAIATRSRWRTSDTQRNALFPTGSPTAAADYLAGLAETARAAFPGTTRLALRYAATGQAVAPGPDDLVLGGNLMSIALPMDEFVTDNRLTGALAAAGEHRLAIGITHARSRFGFARTTGTALLAVEGQARRLDVVALDADGAPLGRITDNGFQRYGSIFDDARLRTNAMALYAADEWQATPALRIDVGARWEHEAITGSVADKQLVDLGDPTTLADDAVTTPAGTQTRVRRAYSALGWSIGAHYRLSPESGLFARYTDSFRLPAASEFVGQPLREESGVVPIRMGEAGARFEGGVLSASTTLFYTHYDRLPLTDYRFDTATNAYVERVAIARTTAVGAEVEARVRPRRWFDLALLATLQDSRYSDFAFTELVDGHPVRRDYSGNRLVRVPALALRAIPALTLLSDWLRIEAEIAHFSRRYADIANTRVLPAYTMLDLAVRLEPVAKLGVLLQVTNLTNSLGLTEGNPRAGAFEAGDPTSRYFLARPEFGRSIRLSIRTRF